MHRHSLSLITSLTSLGLWLIPASALYLGGCSSPTATVTNQVYTPEQLQQIARSIAVKVLSGDNRGSGTLISRRGDGQNQVYTVLTNSHVVTPGQPYRIETPDGQVYPAELKGGALVENFAGKDAALLEFRSSNDYPVATQTGNSPTVGDKVLAAGFPYDGDGLVFAPGIVELLSDPALQGGYQVGYSSEIQQGMSGGPVLSSQGELVAINGMAAFPILQQAYTYMDGSRPDDGLRQQMNRLSWGVPVAALIPPSPNTEQKPPLTGLAAEVDEIAAKITVRIEAETGNGSGVIIAQNGTTYYVATATHVVPQKAKYQVVTPDGKRYPVNYSNVTLFPGVDLAVLQFSSQQTYPVATLAEYKLEVDEQQWVFLSGWPGVQPGNPFQREFTAGLAFSEFAGSVVVQNSSSLANGYELVYTNLSKKGMSGGPVLDTQGRVIGIHTAAEGDDLYEVELGYSLGVPIRTLIGLASQAGIESEWLKVETVPPRKLTEQEEKDSLIATVLTLEKPSATGSYENWVNYGNQLWRVSFNELAVKAFDQAIKIKPKSYPAWYGKGLALKEEERYREAIAAFDQVIQIQSNISEAWRERGEAFARLKDYPQALASIDAAIKHSRQPDFKLSGLRGDWLSELKRYPEAVDAYSEAIKIKPHLFAYYNRGNAWSNRENYEKAIADYTQAINLDPELAAAYSNRGLAWSNLKDYQKAITDYTQAINLDPKLAAAYSNRGIAWADLKDYEKAIADYNQAINLDPKYAAAYNNRGNAWYELKEYEKAIADYTQAINLDPKDALAYNNRGIAWANLKEYEKAIADYTQAINLDPKDALAYNNRGIAWRNRKEYEKAIADFTQAINLDPKDAAAYGNRGIAYIYLGDKETAIEDMKKAEQLFCQQGDPKCELARDALKLLDK
ncbi:tetratricopeptide repeat protein [Planktothricoides sp. SR001]|uniref:tetratricopeptide repeat protein n=1 Tax=Planktothricoides sp. SR001 TaxID=1705388 RepID=UPI0006C871F4|nr:tetratricopeptide repeat protein [Planktothricoides sp. SR001]